jgi:hypothetical protein
MDKKIKTDKSKFYNDNNPKTIILSKKVVLSSKISQINDQQQLT